MRIRCTAAIRWIMNDYEDKMNIAIMMVRMVVMVVRMVVRVVRVRVMVRMGEGGGCLIELVSSSFIRSVIIRMDRTIERRIIIT